ncbi:aspartyl protease family protein [Sphingomonas sp. MMS24-J45]|uniref:aspartyl protease family protein n=1 Tax=Sphingomonas sp. MMS24-J45 TaxID=3238806 RepID=UPI00384DEE53
MRRITRIVQSLLLVGSAWTAGAAAARTDAAAKPPAAGEIRLFQSPDRVLVMMQIDNRDLVPMVFDTGSDGATIDASLARRFKMRTVGQVHEIDGTTGKERFLPQVAIRDVTLGGLKVPLIEAASVDYDRRDAMGIVSSEMFTDSLLYLDLGASRALLVPRATAQTPAGPATAYVESIPSVDLVLPDGSTIPAHFDTGYNGALSLPVAMMDKVPLMAPAKIAGRFKSINTEGEFYGGQIKGTIKIGPVTLENPKVAFLGTLANIGLPIIRRVTLVIDPSADRNWVLPPGARPEVGK